MARRTKTKAKEAAPRIKINDARDVVKLLLAEVIGLEQEQFWVVAFNTHNLLVGHEMIAKGTVESVEVHPRDVFRFAVRTNATGIVCAHNHPSGNIAPSVNDLELTKRLRAVGQILGIPVIDHVVLLESGEFTSIAAHMGSEF